jgi:hypothetical protein
VAEPVQVARIIGAVSVTRYLVVEMVTALPRPSLKFAPAIRRKLSLLNRLDRKSLPKSVHVDIHKSANL